MTSLLIVLACLAGLSAFGFGLAGVLGLLNLEPPEEKQRRFPFVVDQLVTGGIVSMMEDVVNNWPERVTERRLVYAGVANGVACLAFLWLVRAVS